MTPLCCKSGVQFWLLANNLWNLFRSASSVTSVPNTGWFWSFSCFLCDSERNSLIHGSLRESGPQGFTLVGKKKEESEVVHISEAELYSDCVGNLRPFNFGLSWSRIKTLMLVFKYNCFICTWKRGWNVAILVFFVEWMIREQKIRQK